MEEKALNFGVNINNNNINNGAPKLPIGYRFRPTDEELVVHYLKKKALSLPLPASIIPELNVLQIDPFYLPGDVREKRYFFYKKKKSENIDNNVMIKDGNKKSILGGSSSSGFWKPVGKGRLILASDNPNDVVGFRRTMAFCSKGKRWLLHEYHLVRSGPTPNSLHLISYPVEANEYWVVCGVIQKKRRPRGANNTIVRKINIETNKPCCFNNVVVEEDCSSVITDHDDDNDD